MITREMYTDKLNTTNELDCDIAWAIIEQEREQYQALVDAAVAWDQCDPNTSRVWTDTCNSLIAAVKPFLPPPSIPDRLDALAVKMSSLPISTEVHAIAAELREKHGGGE